MKHDQPYLSDSQDCYYLLFKSSSMLNHSCEPNAYRSFYKNDSSVCFIKATRDIEKDEEVTISYVDLLMNVKERRESIRGQYGFECRCKRCLDEEA